MLLHIDKDQFNEILSQGYSLKAHRPDLAFVSADNEYHLTKNGKCEACPDTLINAVPVDVRTPVALERFKWTLQ